MKKQTYSNAQNLKFLWCKNWNFLISQSGHNFVFRDATLQTLVYDILQIASSNTFEKKWVWFEQSTHSRYFNFFLIWYQFVLAWYLRRLWLFRFYSYPFYMLFVFRSNNSIILTFYVNLWSWTLSHKHLLKIPQGNACHSVWVGHIRQNFPPSICIANPGYCD